MKKIMLVFIVVFILFVTVACVTGGVDDAHTRKETSDGGFIYELFYIEEMPCLRVGRGSVDSVWDYDGVTCDWSKFSSESE